MSPSRFNPLSLAEKITGRPMGAGTRHFLKDSIFYSMANFLPRAVGLLILPLVTFFIPPEGYIVYSNYNSAITFLVVLLSFSAQESIARYFYEEKSDFPDFLGTQVLFTGFTIAAAAVLIFASQKFCTWALQIPPLVLWLAVLTAAAQVYDLVYMQLLLARKKSKAYFRYSWIKQLCYIGLVVTLLLFFQAGRLYETGRYLALVYANMASVVPLGLVFLVLLVREMRPVFRWEHWKYSLPLNASHAAGALALAALYYFDRVYISHHDRKLAGEYAFACQYGMLISMVSSGVFSAYMPRFYESMNRGLRDDVQRMFTRNMNMLLLAAAGLIVASGPVVYAISIKNPAYRNSLSVVPIVISGFLFMWMGQCLGLYMTYRRRFLKAKMYTQIMAGALNVALNIWLLPLYKYDTRVAALNTLIPMVLQWLLLWAIARWELKERIVTLKGAMVPFLAYVIFAVLWCVFAY